MSLQLRIAWVTFVAGTAVVTVWANTSSAVETHEGGGGTAICSCFGLLMLVVLIVGTGVERWQRRRRRTGRGFDVIMNDEREI